MGISTARFSSLPGSSSTAISPSSSRLSAARSPSGSSRGRVDEKPPSGTSTDGRATAGTPPPPALARNDETCSDADTVPPLDGPPPPPPVGAPPAGGRPSGPATGTGAVGDDVELTGFWVLPSPLGRAAITTYSKVPPKSAGARSVRETGEEPEGGWVTESTAVKPEPPLRRCTW
jgi:hypothetical protein